MNTSKLLLALASCVSIANLASAHSHLENKLRDRGLDARPSFVDIDARLKRLTAESAATPSRLADLETRFSLSPGYASNPTLAPHSHGAFFVGAAAGIGYERTNDVTQSVLAASYDVGGLFYEGNADENNELSHVLHVAWQKQLAPEIQFRIGASDTQLDLDYSSFLNVAAGYAEVRSTLTADYVGGFSYVWQHREAQFDVTSLRRDGDAVRHIPSVFVATDLARFGQGLPQVTLAYSYYFNLADGADEDFAAQRVALTAANWQLPLDISGSLEASYEDRSGENFSSRLAGLDRQGDELTRGQLTLSRSLMALRGSHVALIVGYERSESNIASANYKGWTYAASISRAF